MSNNQGTPFEPEECDEKLDLSVMMESDTVAFVVKNMSKPDLNPVTLMRMRKDIFKLNPEESFRSAIILVNLRKVITNN